MSGEVHFFYCTGTSHTWSMFENGFRQAIDMSVFLGDNAIVPSAGKTIYVQGLNGQAFPWENGAIQNDPFPFMLNESIWTRKRVAYAATSFNLLSPSTGALIGGMGSSITDGVNKVMAEIGKLPTGTPFALGGTSQGAAVMSTIYNELRSGSLTYRYPDFIGGVMFGNPRRQVNHRGEIGGTWSGAWDDPGSTTGGHGSFPATGNYARLSGCDGTEWIEFAYPEDIITATGDTPTGSLWTQGNDVLLDLGASQYFGNLISQFLASLIGISGDMLSAINAAFSLAGGINYLIDAIGKPFEQPGRGHVLASYLPPVNADGTIPSVERTITVQKTLRVLNKVVPYEETNTYLEPVGETAYQLALRWLEAKAQEWARAPIIVPSTGSVGWSTTLVPPA